MGTVSEDLEFELFLKNFTLPQKKEVIPRAKRKKIIVIAGPTAVGKTQLSLLVAKALNGEIISADSMQVYRGMDIGTAKVGKKERQDIPHHLIDIKEVTEGFNVAQFYHAAMSAIRETLLHEAVPVVVGGTGFYLHSLLYGPPSGPPSEPELRKNLEKELKEQGSSALYERLRLLDPEYAGTITQRDRHKIVRALEIISLTNKKVSQFQKVPYEGAEHFDFRCWFLYMPKEVLYPRIEMRCDKMIADGLIDEVKQLKELGIEKNSSAAHAIGYRQCLEFLATQQSQDDWDHFVTAFKQASRRYSKRQMTWFRNEPQFRWLNVHALSPQDVMETVLQDYELSF